MTDFTCPDQSNATKGAVHGALGTLAVLCAVYNGCAWIKRKEGHSALNVLVYGALLAFEAYQVYRHGQH